MTLPIIAQELDTALVIVKREPMELDVIADLVVQAEIGAMLGRLAG